MKIPWSKPDITDWERSAASDVVESGWVTMGEETAKFEEEARKLIGCDYLVAVNNGTSALIAALMAHEAKGVTLPSYTFQATLNAPALMNLFIRFRDVDPRTVLMKTPEKMPNPGEFYVPVSYAGLPIPDDEWEPWPLIEDAAEAFGAKTQRAATGGQGWTAIFSFHAAKLITTVEGGAVATNDLKIAKRLRSIRSQGEDPKIKGRFTGLGLNLKPTDIQSAIGRVQLKKLDEYLDNRFLISLIYERKLDDVVEFQEIPDYVERHANMMFPVFVENPMGLAEYLREKEISTRLGWVPLTPDPGAQKVSEKVICLPIFNTMTTKEAHYVADAVLEALQ